MGQWTFQLVIEKLAPCSWLANRTWAEPVGVQASHAKERISYWINMLFVCVPHPWITIVLGQILNWLTKTQARTVQLTQPQEPDSSFWSILIATHVLKLNSSFHCLPFLFLPWHLIGFLSLLVSILIDLKMSDAPSINCKTHVTSPSGINLTSFLDCAVLPLLLEDYHRHVSYSINVVMQSLNMLLFPEVSGISLPITF